jgi:hypothetical protein
MTGNRDQRWKSLGIHLKPFGSEKLRYEATIRECGRIAERKLASVA